MKKMLSSALTFLLLCGLIALFETDSQGSGSEKPILVSALPKDNEIAGWKREGQPFLARGFADLAKQINGGAPFYIERGVVESVFQDYINKKNTIRINIVLHQTAIAAEARRLYHDSYAESPLPLHILGNEGRGLPKLIGAYSLQFCKGPVYADLTISDKSLESQAALLSFAKRIARKLTN
ncbi:MAG: hypothetical protein A2Y79_12495 [Deltaproteobacteria bacterium RBG_13_43_22]|nr:MAG: hypothetical protein A2Y79_12495 [Deltaproteobacteria bacterium RBG_13_43_22]